MLSVIIATHDSERPLVRTLAALVPGATSGLINEVLIADGGSRDDTTAVADIAGCKLVLRAGASLGQRLSAAAHVARAPWFIFVRPGTILDTPWIGEARDFVERPRTDVQAAVFRRLAPTPGALREALPLIAALWPVSPHPNQGLLIAREFYRQIGGHSELAADPESELLRRIGRQRIALLSARAFPGNT
jgi:glycosyltransferase involved in cell wall biosynthesis